MESQRKVEKKLLTETLTRRCLKLSGEIQTLEGSPGGDHHKRGSGLSFEQVEVLLEPGSWENRLEIIDTPGTNPGSESARNTAEGHRKS